MGHDYLQFLTPPQDTAPLLNIMLCRTNMLSSGDTGTTTKIYGNNHITNMGIIVAKVQSI